MNEITLMHIKVIMRSGRVYEIDTDDCEMGWLYDKMFGREVGNFQNIGGMIINITDIEAVIPTIEENEFTNSL